MKLKIEKATKKEKQLKTSAVIEHEIRGGN